MAVLQITEYTDPACPFAWSAEPVRQEVRWRYGDEIAWSVRLVVLSESRKENEDKGFTPAKLSKAWGGLAAKYGMPMDTSERVAVAASLPACRAVVAARVHAPGSERAVLRGLRVRNFAGQLLDDPMTIRGAAEDAGLDPDELERWLSDDAVETALREDMAAARHPSLAASALAHKLASWPGGLRYTCPSYEIARVDDPERTMSVPGFQPIQSVEVAIANLAPELDRGEASSDVEEVLRWAHEPLATAEVAALIESDLDEARQHLSRVAQERPIGQDGLWSLAD